MKTGKLKKPTLKRQVDIFHKFMNIVNIASISGKSDRLKLCLEKMNNWSYAHRMGNGQFTDSEQDQLVYHAFEELAKTVES